MVRHLLLPLLIASLVPVTTAGCSKNKRESTQLFNQGIRAKDRKQFDAALQLLPQVHRARSENAMALYQMGEIDF